MAHHRWYRWLMVGLFFLAAVMRLGLGAVNRQANDNHLEVAALIAATHHLPDQPDCHECQQAKLYHLSVATLQPLVAPSGGDGAILLAQSLNILLSLVTLAVVAWYVDGQPWPQRVRLAAFALLAFNPAWVGINVQATNDTFVICWSTLALVAALDILSRLRAGRPMPASLVAGLLLCAGAAAASKANGLLAILLAAGVVGVALLLARFGAVAWSGRTLAASGGALAASLLLALGAGQYWHNTVTFGTPITINYVRQPLPRLFEPTAVYWAGITNVARGYFSFDLLDLLWHPYVLYNDDAPEAVFPPNRTSLWSQLYGTAHSLQFHEHPPSWASWHPLVQNINRATFVLALLPTGLVLVGAGRTAFALARLVRQRSWQTALKSDGWLLLIGVVGNLAAYVAYSLQCRSFVCQKAIFVLPTSLLLLPMFAAGYLWLIAQRPFARRVALTWILDGGIFLLGLAYLAQAGLLFVQLAR